MRPRCSWRANRALKVKRAVRFPFLDFSTLAKRRAACEAEIEANRPFAPELYHGVVAITREAGSAARHRRKGQAGGVGGGYGALRRDANARPDRRPLGHRYCACGPARPHHCGGACARPGGRGRAMDRGARLLYRAERDGVRRERSALPPVRARSADAGKLRRAAESAPAARSPAAAPGWCAAATATCISAISP